MAIPLRKLKSPDSDTRHDRDSIDSEASAILSYALGKHEDLDDQSETDIDSPRRSSFALEDEDTEAFLKENDPLEGDYEPWTTRLVTPFDEYGLMEEIPEISNICLCGFDRGVFGMDYCVNWVFVEGVFFTASGSF